MRRIAFLSTTCLFLVACGGDDDTADVADGTADTLNVWQRSCE